MLESAGAGRYAPYPSAIQKRSREPVCSAAAAPAPARKAPEDRPQKTRKKTSSELLQPLVAAPEEPSAPPPHLLHGLGSLLEEEEGEPKARSAGGRTAALRKALSAAIDTVRLDPLALPFRPFPLLAASKISRTLGAQVVSAVAAAKTAKGVAAARSSRGADPRKSARAGAAAAKRLVGRARSAVETAAAAARGGA